MSTRIISRKFTWFLVIGLALLLLTTFISCADDLIGPVIKDDKEPDTPNDEEQDPNDGGGSGGGGGLALIIESSMSGQDIVFIRSV
ncbi:MAG: hypothetical protein ACE5IR_10300 [bacterium]